MIYKCENHSYKASSSITYSEGKVQGIKCVSYREYTVLTKYKHTFSCVLSFGMRMNRTNQQNRDTLVKLH